MKKILLLGGSHGQIPAIKESKNRNLYTILCDYLPDNPGQEFADEYHNVSTTDIEAVLSLSKQKEVDYIFAYISDPAVLTTASVSKKLGLRGNTPESIHLLSQKDKFRNLMKENGFRVPKFVVLEKPDLYSFDADDIDFPIVVKPVDSSDTKGVHKVEQPNEFHELAEKAFSSSRADRIIAEEYVDSGTANFHGDAFIIDGEMRFCLLGDNLFFSDSNPLKPSSEVYPSKKPKKLVQAVEEQVENLIRCSGYKNGPVNLEIRVDSDGDIYIMEIGPRSGGTFTPQTIAHSTGFDMLKASLDFLEGKQISIPETKNLKPTINFVLHSNTDGILRKLEFDERIQEYIVEKHLHVEPGDFVKSFKNPNSNLGVVILKFNNFEEMDVIIDDLYDIIMSGIEIEVY